MALGLFKHSDLPSNNVLNLIINIYFNLIKIKMTNEAILFKRFKIKNIIRLLLKYF